MKKILILGSKGMAGHMITDYLRAKKNVEIFTTSRDYDFVQNHFFLDIFNTQGLKEILSSIQPDYVLNCIGILVKSSEDNPDEAIFVNAYIPHVLNKLSKDFRFKLIHLSSDCVFSGTKGFYTEFDIPDEIGVYGKTKALGEIKNARNLTIRTSIIGPELKKNGIGLFHWFMQQKGDINGYTKVVWSGVTTLELARFIDYIIANNIALSGLYHLVNNTSITKRDLLFLFQEIFGKDDVIIHDYGEVISNKSIINTLHQIKYDVQSYDQMVREMYSWMALSPEKNAQYIPAH